MDLVETLALQSGVVARRQVSLSATELRRLLRRRELVRVYAGVYVDHTGPLTAVQRDWAAVLACWPAALCHCSVTDPGRGGPVHVAVAHHRTLVAPPGVIVHRMSDLDERVRWNAAPPAVRLEHAVLDVALQQPDVPASFGVLADAVQSRRTTVDRLQAALASRRRMPCRRLLADLLDDLATGASSVLEREYLLLERSHGLPSAARQHKPAGARSRYQDVRYVGFGVVVELDSRAFHDSARARDRDAGRDLDHAVQDDGVTVRLTYGQVFRDGCTTIHQVAALLRRRGWTGRPLRCPTCP